MARMVGLITKPAEIIVSVDNDNIPHKETIDYSSLSRDEVRKLLEERGIEYSPHTGTEKLIKLLEGAE